MVLGIIVSKDFTDRELHDKLVAVLKPSHIITDGTMTPVGNYEDMSQKYRGRLFVVSAIISDADHVLVFGEDDRCIFARYRAKIYHKLLEVLDD